MKRRPVALHLALLFASLIGSYAMAEEALSEQDDEANATTNLAQEASPSAQNKGRQQFRDTQALLADEFSEDQIVWLKARYPDQAEPIEVLALKNTPKKAKALGAVVLLHDMGKQAATPSLLRSLHTDLPFDGWYTISVSLPTPETPKIPERDLPTKTSESWQKLEGASANATREAPTKADAGKQAAEPDNAEGQDDNVDINLADTATETQDGPPSYANLALSHLQAAVNHLSDKNFQNIVMVADRNSASIALDYIQPIAAQMTESGFSLILIDAQFTGEDKTKLSRSLGQDFQAPVLDIVNKSNLTTRALAKERKATVIASGAKAYQQVQLNLADLASSERFVQKRIADWLKAYAPAVAE